MPRTKYFILIAFVFLILKTNAQEIIYDATLNYGVSVNSEKDKSISKLFEGATYKIYLKGLLSKTELKTSLGIETSIYDGKENRGTILKEYSNQKLMIPMSEENWNEKNKSFHKLQFKQENDNMVINGIACKKATALNSKGDNIIVYFNPTMIFSNKEFNNCFSMLPGIPVRYEQQLKNGTKYIYSLMNIDYDIISSNKFESPKSGFRIISYEEATKTEK
jgi:hypothetical protein